MYCILEKHAVGSQLFLALVCTYERVGLPFSS
jgi:hypothetical protein